MTGRRAANESLRALLTTAGWTYEALARNVNALGAENGMRLRYDRTSVAHWLAGSVPRPRTRELIVEAFSRRLCRPVALAELGMGCPAGPGVPGAAGPWGEVTAAERGDAVAHLAELCGADADPARRNLVQEAVCSAAGFEVPRWEERRSGRGPGERPGGGGPGGEEDTVHLRAAVEFFRRAGDFGGRHARTALVVYLRDDVVPRLHEGGPGGAPPRLLAEAARLVHVLARMYADDIRNGAAQSYHRAALRLAAEAGDRTVYASVLRTMSEHALEVGHRRAALRLAEAAARAAPADTPAHDRALLLAQLALAQAATGDGEGAAATLAEAERHRVPAPGAALRGTALPSSRASFAHCRGRTLAALGDRAAAVAALRSSVEHHPATAHLHRALTHAELARLLLADGRLGEACTAWHRFLDDYPHLRSGRADRALAELRGNLRAHAAHPPARALLCRADAAGRREGPWRGRAQHVQHRGV